MLHESVSSFPVRNKAAYREVSDLIDKQTHGYVPIILVIEDWWPKFRIKHVGFD